MGTIAFVSLCHADYVDENSAGWARRAACELTAQGLDIMAIEQPVVDYKTARIAGQRIASANADGVILFLGTWVECPNVMALVREVEHLPLCLWGFPMFEHNGALTSTGSYVSYTMFKGSMDRLGYRYIGVMGMPDDRATIERVCSFSRAAGTLQAMKRLRIGYVGYTSMGIYTGTFDHVLMRGRIGPEVLHYDSYTLINRAHALGEGAFAEPLDRLRRQRVRGDVTDENLSKAARFTQALLDLCREDGLDGINVKCQYEFSKEYGFVMCVPLSLLADYGLVSSCEGDMLCTVSMAMLRLLSGQTVTYGDSINAVGDVVKFSSCGFMPFSMGAGGMGEIRAFMPHPGFSGIQCSFVQRPERVTIVRLIEDVGDYHILCMRGQGLHTDLRGGYMPALDVELDGSAEDFLRHANGQHYAIVYGDVTGRLRDYARLAGIRLLEV